MTAWRVIVALILAASVPVPSLADEVIRIPRENGAVHREFRQLLAEVLGRFQTGVGRAELSGSGGAEPCVVNFFTNKDTTFVTVNVGYRTQYTEFYIDHPTESFKSVLFQSLTVGEKGRELKVVTRELEYSVQVEDDLMTLKTRAGKTRPVVTCSFELASVRLYEGQTE
jgi:hypothetical protein